jgi:hypothetical protein
MANLTRSVCGSAEHATEEGIFNLRIKKKNEIRLVVSCIYAGLVARTNFVAPNVPSKHCGNHKEALASKRKPEGSKPVLEDAAKLANLVEQPTNSIIFGERCER